MRTTAGLVSHVPLGSVGGSSELAFTLAPTQLSFRARCLVRCVIGRGLRQVGSLESWLNGVDFEDISAQVKGALQDYIQSQLGEQSADLRRN